jgi:hypothetical protein
MQMRAGGEAEAADVSGVGRDFGFDEDDVKHAGVFSRGDLRPGNVQIVGGFIGRGGLVGPV